MGQPAARQNDQVTGIDTHLCVPPSGRRCRPTLPFTSLVSALSRLFINGLPAAPRTHIHDTQARNPASADVVANRRNPGKVPWSARDVWAKQALAAWRA